MKKITLSFLALITLFITLFLIKTEVPDQSQDELTVPEGRWEWELARLADPETGEIPPFIHMRELEYASKLPKSSGNKRSGSQEYFSSGPYNVGGRTRAIAYDISNPNIILAAGVSGGLWRSEDKGQSWERTSNLNESTSATCLAQDKRPGKQNVWYYGSGETVSNSASKSFSAPYRGTGVYKSTNGGITWIHLLSTETHASKENDWTGMYRIVTDHTRNDSDIVLVATRTGILRTNDGGLNWHKVLLGPSFSNLGFSEIAISSNGIYYAALSSNSVHGGYWRSVDGISWTNITPTNGYTGSFSRTVLAIAPSNEDVVYFLTDASVDGNLSNPTDPLSERHALWKYTYLSGYGSGNNGQWDNRSSSIPSDESFQLRMTTFNGYCMLISIKPNDENTVFIGGTNLFRSTNGFLNKNTNAIIGGYRAQGYTDFNYYRDNQHPDQQIIAFHPNNPNEMIAATDGGLHLTQNCTAFKVIWESLNNGYVTGQFYGIGIDHASTTDIICGGFQDNGTWWTNNKSSNHPWVHTRGGDGAYVWVEDGNTGVYYFSTQRANIQRTRVNNTNGNVISRKTVMPSSSSPYLFVHPFAIDPANNNIMYLPNGNRILINRNLAAAEQDILPWVTQATLPVSQNITAISASKNPQGIVYVGTNNRRIFKLEGAHNATPTPIFSEITNNISNGAYTSNIAIDPRDGNKVIVVYSNYNTISLWYSENGGDSWEHIEGNLAGTPDPGTPPNLWYISNGPSIRWVRIIPLQNGETVYLAGTSVGLYATNKLEGENTVWIQQGSSVIGNAVVDMIDSRETDGYTVIATHGNGVFHTYITNSYDITSTDQTLRENNINLNIYPNPAQHTLNIQVSESIKNANIRLIDQSGRLIQAKQNITLDAHQAMPLNINHLASGVYFISIQSKTMNVTKKILKQ